MDPINTNKSSEEKDLSNSFSQGFKKVLNAKGGYEKRALILLIVILVVGVPLSIWQISSSISSPFAIKKTNKTNNANASVSQVSQTPVIENLRELDTDLDGLSDYDELYRYETSPYIADSDSDKISDKIEVDQGTNPNCAEGQTCGRQDVADLVNADEQLTNLENMSVEQLRQLMIDAGAPTEQVNSISDDDLLSTYESILATENINTNTVTDNTNEAFSLDAIDYETLLNLNAEEIRQLLIEGGVPQATLDQVDDESLKEIYIESLGQNFEELAQ